MVSGCLGENTLGVGTRYHMYIYIYRYIDIGICYTHYPLAYPPLRSIYLRNALNNALDKWTKRLSPKISDWGTWMRMLGGFPEPARGLLYPELCPHHAGHELALVYAPRMPSDQYIWLNTR